MIRKLVLEDYGKFRDRSFDFKAVTVFAGPNEAGKTTVFDALTEALCARLHGKHARARQLRDRYGSNRKARVEREPADAACPAMDDFLALYAVRGGELVFPISDDASWMATVKAKLFAGGVNPQHLLQALETLASRDGKLAHNRALKKAEDDLEEAQRQLEKYRSEREGILQREEQIRRGEAEVKAKKEEERRVKDRLEELTRRVQEQEQIGKRVRLEAVNRMLHEIGATARWLEENQQFAADRAAELDRLREDADRCKARLEECKRQKARLQEASELLAVQLRQKEEESAPDRARKDLASNLLDCIRDAEQVIVPRAAREWRWGVVALCASVALTGGVLAAVASATTVKIVGAAMAVLALLWLALAGWRVEAKVDDAACEEQVERFLNEWNAAGQGGSPAKARTFDELKQVLMQARVRALAVEEEINRLRGDLEAKCRALEHQSVQGQQAERELTTALQAEKDWLAAVQAGSRDEYVGRVAEYRARQTTFGRLQAEVERVREEFGCRDMQDLEAEVRRRLRDMDEAGVARTGMSEQELQALRRERDDAAGTLESLTRSMAELKQDLSRQRGVVAGALGRLPQLIAIAGQAVAEAQQRAEELQLNRKAADVAAGLVRKLCEQADQVFAELADAIRDELEVVLGARRVEVEALSANAIAVADAAGANRRVELLSRGTRDCFVLAARLALARRAGAAHVLVLDEPFLSLDDTRRRQAVTLLKRFREQTGWQLVVFTKDPQLVQDLAGTFPMQELIRHDLGLSPATAGG